MIRRSWRQLCSFYAQTRAEEICRKCGARGARVVEDDSSYSRAYEHPREICRHALTGAQCVSSGKWLFPIRLFRYAQVARRVEGKIVYSIIKESEGGLHEAQV